MPEYAVTARFVVEADSRDDARALVKTAIEDFDDVWQEFNETGRSILSANLSRPDEEIIDRLTERHLMAWAGVPS